MTSADPNQTPPPEQQKSKSGLTLSLGQIVGIVLLILMIVFIAENTDRVRIRFIAGPKVSAPLYLALLIAAVVGVLAGALFRARRKRQKNK